MSFRSRELDDPKTGAELSSALVTICQAPGCEDHISVYTGPNSKKYCRKHQLECYEYGGLARGSKPYSIGKTSVCSMCKVDFAEHPQIKAITDEETRNRALRSIMTTDHIDGNHDNNDPSNIQHLCSNCHNIKTTTEKDYLS